jgi:hypothetical protein
MGMLFPVGLMKNSWTVQSHPYPHPTQEEALMGREPDLALPEQEAGHCEAGGCHL